MWFVAPVSAKDSIAVDMVAAAVAAVISLCLDNRNGTRKAVASDIGRLCESDDSTSAVRLNISTYVFQPVRYSLCSLLEPHLLEPES